MRRLLMLLTSVMLVLAAAGCTSGPAQAPSPPPGEAKAPPTGLMSFRSPQELTVEGLTQGLTEFANAGDGPLRQRLEQLYEHWQLKPREGQVLLAEADVDGNGTPELITALEGASQGGGLNGLGRLFVIYQTDGKYAVDWIAGEDYARPALHGVLDLTGEDRPEILWSATTVGAHTAHSQVFASTWRPGELKNLPGTIGMASMKLTIDGRDVVLHGGLINSVGAGPYQREHTDRYRWVGDRFVRVDIRFTESDEGYHRLQDGIVAEQSGRLDDALRAYREAFDPGTLRPHMEFEPAGTFSAEAEAAFADALHSYARFRLGALLMQANKAEEARQVLKGAKGAFSGLPMAMLAAPSREAGCSAAGEFAKANPDFLKALNSPYGYANPHWEPTDLCGPLPPPR